MKTVVLKFGGTSVGSIDRIKKVCKIIASYKKKKNKGIYGTASKKEIKELKEEGVEAELIPWVEDKRN